METWNDVFLELAKASPFALLCVVFTFILNASHKRQTEELNRTYNRTIDDIKEVYEKVYKKLDNRKNSTK